MPEPVDLLMLEFLRWVSSCPRTYAEAMEAWQTTCPRHTIWEDALIDGLIQVECNGAPHHFEVVLTARGTAILEESSRESTPAKPLPRV
jgi:hypothetical protein